MVFFANAMDPDGDDLELRWVHSDPWQLEPGSQGEGTTASALSHRFVSGGEYLVAANAIDATGRMGFDSMIVTAYEPGDDCSTPRVIPGDGPFPYTILTENHGATVGAEDPEVPCTTWPGDPNSGRWASIWLEFTPSESGTYTFSTCGSVPDTALSGWTGPSCGPYEPIAGACNDDDRLEKLRRPRHRLLARSRTRSRFVTIRVMVGAPPRNRYRRSPDHRRLPIVPPAAGSLEPAGFGSRPHLRFPEQLLDIEPAAGQRR